MIVQVNEADLNWAPTLRYVRYNASIHMVGSIKSTSWFGWEKNGARRSRNEPSDNELRRLEIDCLMNQISIPGRVNVYDFMKKVNRTLINHTLVFQSI